MTHMKAQNQITVETQTMVKLSGNPFVDTGLAVIASLANLSDIHDLTMDHIRSVHGDGSELARRNARLKSFSQVFGTNNPLFQKGYGYTKGKGPSATNFRVYQRTLDNFIDPAYERIRKTKCEACGSSSLIDFARACTAALAEVGKEAPQEKNIGRDWFPLVGSLGSDAQALPGASRSVSLCGRCLFAVHYLPLGILLLDGRPTVFQSNSTDFWYGLVRDLVEESVSRIQAGEHAAIGAKEGTRHLIGRLLALFSKTAAQPHGTLLFAWRFSNSGSSAECKVDVIPDKAVEFLSIAANHGLSAEVQNCAAHDHKRSKPFLQCISEGVEYAGLYPQGQWSGASPRLYRLYLKMICERSPSSIRTAKAVALQIRETVTAKEMNRLLRCDPQRDPDFWRILRRSLMALVKSNELSHATYLDLFPLQTDSPGIHVDRQGRASVWYFLHHLDEHEPSESTEPVVVAESDHLSRLLYCAACIFRSRIDQLGTDRFNRDILGRLDRGALRLEWLRQEFTVLATTYPNFTYSDWTWLTEADHGTPRVDELIFQLRIVFMEWFGRGTPEPKAPIPLPSSTGLPSALERRLAEYFRHYVDTRGMARFRRDILQRIRRRQIDFAWLIARLHELNVEGSGGNPLTAEALESFAYDEDGRPARQRRLFQMHLHLANLVRLETEVSYLENAR